MKTLCAVFQACVHDDRCSRDVCFQEYFGIIERTVNVAFCGEIHGDIGTFRLKYPINGIPVGDIRLIKCKIFQAHHIGEIVHIPRIGQAVDADDPVSRVIFYHMADKIAADKACAACYKHVHTIFPFGHMIFMIPQISRKIKLYYEQCSQLMTADNIVVYDDRLSIDKVKYMLYNLIGK